MSSIICSNKKANFEYKFEESLQAGLVLFGWEIKSLRAGKAQLSEAFIHIRNGEAWLVNSVIQPLGSASSHVEAVADRRRKLLLHKKQLTRLVGQLQTKGFTAIPLNLEWLSGRVKCKFGVGTGKKKSDKRLHIKDREWKRQQQRIMKQNFTR